MLLPWVTALAVAFGITATLISAWRESETPDEPVHLEWSRRLMVEGVTERRSNEYFESKSPISMLNVLARRLVRRTVADRDAGRRERVLRFASRLPTVGLLAALLAAVFLMARRWLGPTEAHLAVIACALDPSLIAHGGLATVDVAFALFHFLALSAAYALARSASPGRAVLLGLATGLAFTSKFSAVLLLPGTAIAFATAGHAPGEGRRLLRVGASLLIAAAVATFTICALYLFVQVRTPLAAIRWDSAPLARLAGLLPRLRLPLPADFLTGFDLSLARERELKWRVVVLGRQYPKGVWYYFALLWLMKTPLLILVAQLAGYLRAIQTGLLWRSRPLRFLAVNLAVLLVYFSLLFHAQIGYRFVLMCVPLGYIIAAAGLSTIRARPWVAPVGAVIVLAAMAENAAYLGNHIAFTNMAVQPKKLVFRWITHSNIDWRQNEDRVDDYLARAGIGRDRLDPPHVLAGRNLLHHSHAAGNLRFERYRWVRENLEPVTHFDHTFLLFDLSPEDFERFLEANRRLAPSPLAARLCGAEPPGQRLVAREPFALSDEDSRRPGIWLLCVDAPGGADFILQVASGRLVFGPADRPGWAHDYAELGQELWFRLEPGRHVFTARGQQGFTGAWRTARGEASVSMRLAAESDLSGAPLAGRLRPQREQLEVRPRTLDPLQAGERHVEGVLLVEDLARVPDVVEEGSAQSVSGREQLGQVFGHAAVGHQRRALDEDEPRQLRGRNAVALEPRPLQRPVVVPRLAAPLRLPQQDAASVGLALAHVTIEDRSLGEGQLHRSPPLGGLVQALVGRKVGLDPGPREHARVGPGQQAVEPQHVRGRGRDGRQRRQAHQRPRTRGRPAGRHPFAEPGHEQGGSDAQERQQRNRVAREHEPVAGDEGAVRQWEAQQHRRRARTADGVQRQPHHTGEELRRAQSMPE